MDRADFKCCFAVKYGTLKSGCVLTENLFEGSNQDCSRGEVIPMTCELTDIGIIKSSGLSSRVYSPCAQKGICLHPLTAINIAMKWDSVFGRKCLPCKLISRDFTPAAKNEKSQTGWNAECCTERWCRKRGEMRTDRNSAQGEKCQWRNTCGIMSDE